MAGSCVMLVNRCRRWEWIYFLSAYVDGYLIIESHKNGRYPSSSRVLRALSKVPPPQQAGCVYEGRWHAAGAAVRTREPCLACACGPGALACRRRTCAALADPPPRCHVIHRKGDCCPELRCPDGVQHQHDTSATGRLDDTEIDKPSSIGQACVEGGTVYAAGSAMAARAACEQCFCLRGARRCVRPRCLPPPPGCRARAAPGACCPQRYHCDHAAHDCVTPDGAWAAEGERVKAAETGLECVQCFCLRGSIRCQHLACAPSLRGCTPLLQPGQCCPHQYQCEQHNGTKLSLNPQRHNILMSLRDEDRSFHTSKSTKRETTVKELITVTDKSTVTATVTKKDVTTTAKVKRETEKPNINTSSIGTEKSETSTSTITLTTQKFNGTTQALATETTTLEESSEEFSTEQPPGSVKVIINGTINCTTELSSTSLLLNVSDTNNTVWIDSQTQPRIPIINTIDIESQTFPPHDIITEGSNIEGFDDNETFTINVTSSLRTNTSHSTTTTTMKPLRVIPKTVPPVLLGKVNVSKTKKEEYDYDYAEPTLPPSLPNLKIIPFVAADAVVEDDVSSKESLDYSVLDQEDKFPVYYPNTKTEDTIYATRKVDVYNPTQFPVFISKKVESQYPSLTQEPDDINVSYPSITNEMPRPVQEYTVTASLGNSAKVNYKGEHPAPATNTQFEVEPPAVNLFSPPIETEGGFIPKGPGVEDNYYSVYPSTPSVNIMPYLTTSMQLEPKDECVSGDGRHVSEGESISLSCSVCTCAWGELHCTPRPCNTPLGCRRNVASVSSTDLCCGELICDKLNNTTSMPLMTIQNITINLNETETTSEEKVSLSYQGSTTTSRVYTNIDTIKNTSLESHISEDNKRFEDMIPITLLTASTSEKSVPQMSTEAVSIEILENNNHSLEYEEEDDDDDEGFSLGSVLKLLLSETYDTTTQAPKKKTTTTTTVTSTTPKISSTPASTMVRKPFITSESGFIPVTHRSPYLPPKKLYSQNTINRIDHLVLGESNAIRKATEKSTFKPITQPTTRKEVTSTKTTSQQTTTKTVEISSKEGFGGHSVEVASIPSFISGYGLGLPKLAGCNIYGRMYRVGRIIAELSSPCQECKCTELGVQCRSLNC